VLQSSERLNAFRRAIRGEAAEMTALAPELVFVQLLLNGLLIGAIYALITAGLSLIYGVVGIVNFAHGELYMIGAYAMWIVLAMTGNYLLGVIFSIGFLAVLGLVIERLTIRPLVQKLWTAPLLATLGLSLALQNTVLYIYTATPQFPSTELSQVNLDVSGIFISDQRVAVLVVACLCFLALHTYLKKAKSGKAMRAVSQSRELCKVIGVETGRIYSLAFVIAAALAGIGGALIGPVFFIEPRMGTLPVFKSFCIAVAGGFGNVKGSLYIALLVGMTESLIAGYISGTWKDVFAFLLMLLILIFKPEGLFGKKVGVW
jgi:branched-chain amino acid transport system permease protein